jgi:WD40 repeat protein
MNFLVVGCDKSVLIWHYAHRGQPHNPPLHNGLYEDLQADNRFPITKIPVPSDVLALEFVQTPTTLLGGTRDGKIRLFDLRLQNTAAGVGPPIKLGSSVCCIKALGGNGVADEVGGDRDVVCSDMSGGLSRWDMRTGGMTQRYLGHTNSRTVLEFTVDERAGLLCAPGEDGVARVWDVGSGQLLSEVGPFGTVPARAGNVAVLQSNWGGCPRSSAVAEATSSPFLAMLTGGEDPEQFSLRFYSN